MGKSFAIKSSLFNKWIQKVSYDFKNVKKIPLIQLDKYYSKKNNKYVNPTFYFFRNNEYLIRLGVFFFYIFEITTNFLNPLNK